VGRSPAQEVAEEDLTVITSEKLTFDYQNQYALFEKDVVVVDPSMRLFADTLLVTFDANNKAEKIKAEGKVRILQEDKQARAKVADYNVETGEIVLTGEPQVTRGRDTLTAEVIRFWRDEDRMECSPRARLVIFPDDDDGTRGSLFGE
jgi:lipopolysaccharide export system protein LptA